MTDDTAIQQAIEDASPPYTTDPLLAALTLMHDELGDSATLNHEGQEDGYRFATHHVEQQFCLYDNRMQCGCSSPETMLPEKLADTGWTCYQCGESITYKGEER